MAELILTLHWSEHTYWWKIIDYVNNEFLNGAIFKKVYTKSSLFSNRQKYFVLRCWLQVCLANFTFARIDSWKRYQCIPYKGINIIKKNMYIKKHCALSKRILNLNRNFADKIVSLRAFSRRLIIEKRRHICKAKELFFVCIVT